MTIREHLHNMLPLLTNPLSLEEDERWERTIKGPWV